MPETFTTASWGSLVGGRGEEMPQLVEKMRSDLILRGSNTDVSKSRSGSVSAVYKCYNKDWSRWLPRDELLSTRNRGQGGTRWIWLRHSVDSKWNWYRSCANVQQLMVESGDAQSLGGRPQGQCTLEKIVGKVYNVFNLAWGNCNMRNNCDLGTGDWDALAECLRSGQGSDCREECEPELCAHMCS